MPGGAFEVPDVNITEGQRYFAANTAADRKEGVAKSNEFYSSQDTLKPGQSAGGEGVYIPPVRNGGIFTGGIPDVPEEIIELLKGQETQRKKQESMEDNKKWWQKIPTWGWAAGSAVIAFILGWVIFKPKRRR